MPAVLRQRLLAVQPERMHHRQVVEAEQHGVIAGRRVRVLMEGPRRHAEDVALGPVEALPVDDRGSLSVS
ncbi:hypothetical protein D3C86_2106910 [compost metagenome]